MRMRRVLVALVMALAFAVPAAAQSDDARVTLNAAVGPSFANVGTTVSTALGLKVKLNDRTAPSRPTSPADSAPSRRTRS